MSVSLATRRLAATLVASLALAALFGCGSGGGDNSLDLTGSQLNALQTGATRGAIEARIVAADGTPYAGQSVTIRGEAAGRQEATSLTATTDTQGVVRAGNLPAGNYTIEAGPVRLNLPVNAGQITTRRFDLANPGQPREDLGLLYVVNGLAKTLSIVDTDTGAVTNNAIATGDAPNQVVFHRGIGYVVNSTSNNVQRFNPSTATNLGAIDLGTGANPWAISFAGANKAYVSNLLTNTVAIVDLSGAAPTVTGTIDGVGTSPEGMLRVDGKLYVCATGFSFADFTYGEGRVHVIDTATDRLISTIPLGAETNPQDLVRGADGMLYVLASGKVEFDANWTAHPAGSKVYRIDPTTDQVVGEPLELQGIGDSRPNCGAIALAPGGRAFLPDSQNNRLHVIDTNTGTLLRTGAEALETGTNPLGVATTPNGRVWVFNFVDDTLSVYDATSLSALYHGAGGSGGGSLGAALAVGDGPQTGGGRLRRGLVPAGLAAR